MKNIVPVSIYLTLRKLSKSEQNSHISGNFESIKNGPRILEFSRLDVICDYQFKNYNLKNWFTNECLKSIER